jgi:O-acetyl-ADP-ribose deacetylase (regulator of RNase III)
MKSVTANLLDMFDEGKFDAIAHGCNCFHTMGSGIAKQVKRRYPEAYAHDVKYTVYGDFSKLGDHTFVYYENKGYLFNLYTQFDFTRSERDVEYGSMFIALNSMVSRLDAEVTHPIQIGIPLIGCGLAGGDVDILMQMIERIEINRGNQVEFTLVSLEEVSV